MKPGQNGPGFLAVAREGPIRARGSPNLTPSRKRCHRKQAKVPRGQVTRRSILQREPDLRRVFGRGCVCVGGGSSPTPPPLLAPSAVHRHKRQCRRLTDHPHACRSEKRQTSAPPSSGVLLRERDVLLRRSPLVLRGHLAIEDSRTAARARDTVTLVVLSEHPAILSGPD